MTPTSNAILRLPSDRERWLKTPDGVRLRWACLADGGVAGTVLLLPGRTEFMEKYGREAAAWAGRGFRVYGLDWRNQGLSDRPLTDSGKHHLNDVGEKLNDLAALLAAIGEDGAPSPFLVFGHSMGGHVALRFLADRPWPLPAPPAGLILSAPMVDIRYGLPKAVVRGIVRLSMRLGRASAYAPGQGPPADGPGTSVSVLTHDLDHLNAEARFLSAHPDFRLGGVTIGWLAAVMRSIRRMQDPAFAARVTLPVLMCLAGDDRVVSNAAAQRLARRLPDVRLVTVPGAYHEVWREPEPIRATYDSAVASFVAEVAGGARAPAAPVSTRAD